MIYWCRKQQDSFSCNIRQCEQGLTREREQLITGGSWYNGSDFYMNPIWNKKELKLFGIIPRLVDHKNNIMWNYLYLCNKDSCNVISHSANTTGGATQPKHSLNWYTIGFYTKSTCFEIIIRKDFSKLIYTIS